MPNITRMRFYLTFIAALASYLTVCARPKPAVLYHNAFEAQKEYPELITAGTSAKLTTGGLQLTSPGLVRLNKYYSLARRVIRYKIQLGAGTKAVFQSDQGDFKAFIDMSRKQISIATNPVKQVDASFLTPQHEYLIEVHRDYQVSKLWIKDLNNGKSAEIIVTMDGTGGCGNGAEGPGFFAGLQHDYYCFGLAEGSGMLVKQITVSSKDSKVKLLIYGDSITEPEGYYPTGDFSRSWTQLVIARLKGQAVSSGRGGCTIHEVRTRIANELPYLKTKYVMVTIGTNGGNTEENLSELVDYILSQGAVPILNNIPANESGTQIGVNAVIEKVRQKYRLHGCHFDKATSIDKDGRTVDKNTMYFEDYDWGKIYHHPNKLGAQRMYQQTLIDVPEIYR